MGDLRLFYHIVSEGDFRAPLLRGPDAVMLLLIRDFGGIGGLALCKTEQRTLLIPRHWDILID